MTETLSYQKYDESWGARPVPPIPEESILMTLQNSTAKNPDKPAVIFLDHTTTFQELDQMSDKIAGFLIEKGIKQGDRVATMLPNCTQHAITIFGIIKSGAVVVPYNVMLKGKEAGYILEDSGARALFVLDICFSAVKPEVERLGFTNVITVHPKDFSEASATIPAMLAGEKSEHADTIDFMSVIAGDHDKPPEFKVQAREDLALMIYTSGTTGFPKGAMITHYNLYSAVVQIAAVIGFKENDVFMMLYPLFHVAGIVLNFLPTFYLGATLVAIPAFDPPDFMKLVEKYKGSIFFAPTTAYIAVLNHPDFSKYDLSIIRYTLAGAMPVPPAIQKEWKEKVGSNLFNGWAATETSIAPAIVEMKNRMKPGSNTLGSVTGEIKIVDKEGNIVSRNETGEFIVRGPGIVKGYWNKPDKTREEFTKDGWWISGDIGYMDDEGFIYYVERKKDLIIASGYNIAPAEVENHIFEHDAVLEVSVVGIPDSYRGETVKAYIVLKPDYVGKVTQEELIRYCKDNMAAYKAPKMVEFVDELPKSATGKVLRRILRDRHAAENAEG